MYSVEKAENDDVNEITLIENSLFDQPWTAEQLLHEVSDINSVFKTLRISGRISGYYIINTSFETCEIFRISVIEELQHSGYGSIMLEDILRSAKERSASRIYLEVNENNTAAVNFYKKNGFVKIHERPCYYGSETAYIMEKDLNENS